MGAVRNISQKNLIWLDYCNYATSLLSGSSLSYLNLTDYLSWLRKAQGLLNSDVIEIPIRKLYLEWLDKNPQLKDDLVSKKRIASLLKTLFSDESFKQYCTEFAMAIRGTFNNNVVVLSISSPRLLLADLANITKNDALLNPSEDDVDSAALYMADFLRAFGALGISGICLEESPSGLPITKDTVSLYQTLFNICEQYRWDSFIVSLNTEIEENNLVNYFINSKSPHQIDNSVMSNYEIRSLGDDILGSYASIVEGADPTKVLESISALKNTI